MNYKQYKKSKIWKLKREQLIKEANYICQECGGHSKFFCVHHKHYKTLGRETLKDVEVICIWCNNKRFAEDKQINQHLDSIQRNTNL